MTRGSTRARRCVETLAVDQVVEILASGVEVIGECHHAIPRAVGKHRRGDPDRQRRRPHKRTTRSTAASSVLVGGPAKDTNNSFASSESSTPSSNGGWTIRTFEAIRYGFTGPLSL
jgi:hypothetical protein